MEIIKQTIQNGWTDFFPVKEKKEKEDKSYLDPINSMMTALQNKDIDEYLKTVPAEYQKKMEENYSHC